MSNQNTSTITQNDKEDACITTGWHYIMVLSSIIKAKNFHEIYTFIDDGREKLNNVAYECSRKHMSGVSHVPEDLSSHLWSGSRARFTTCKRMSVL